MALRLRVTSQHKERLGESSLREFAGCGGTIGRARDNDWVLPDEKRFVSSRHALVDFQGGAYYLVDTSRNGVYINGSDAAVGRGHPQRLFNGDRMRLGEYEVEVELVADEAFADDGMRDSLVQAQMVPVDESMELQLVDESKLRAFEYDALERHLKPSGDASSAVRKPPAPVAPVAAAVVKQAAPPAPEANAEALAIFCKAAGLQPADLHGSNPAETLETAGLLMRELLTGLADLLHNRSRVKDALRLPQTIIQSTHNNPLKFSPEVGDALRYLLGEPGDSYLPPDRAVQAAFLDVKHHQQALFKAMIHAVNDFAERLDPEELRKRFDHGLRRPSLLAGANKLRYWDLYEETYAILVQQENDAPLPAVVIDEMAHAYEQEAESLQQRHEAQRPPARSARAS